VILILEITVAFAWVLVQTDQLPCLWICLCFLRSFCYAHYQTEFL